ncbi:MAG: hypothetical protein OJF49_002963 [Ktedonobacterales bacterium]|nr:MAG: hypothetical protein OJF49_002963 [Ktedonobacterales bacterium]
MSVPNDVFSPLISVPTTLVAIRHGTAERIFVGELSNDHQRNQVLLQNLKAHRPGAEPALGISVKASEYRGYEALVAGFRARELARSHGVPPIKLSEITREINFTNATDYPHSDEKDNVVYLPLLGFGSAVTSLPLETQKHSSSYAQLVLDPEKAVADYIAKYLNTRLGTETRRQIAMGTTRPRLDKQLIGELQVYIPDHDTQLATVETDTKIETLVNELREMQERAWAQPRRLTEIQKNLIAVNHEERFQDWLDTLPFPLASILWTYHTLGNDAQRRYERLLHFFEALAEFLAAVLVSGFRMDAEFFEGRKTVLKTVVTPQSFEKSAFGTWVRIAENLASEGRALLNGEPEIQARCLRMFRVGESNREMLTMLFESRIIGKLQEANKIRNVWMGHTGIVGSSNARERLAILERLLADVRTVFGTRWQSYKLLKTGTASLREGVYRHQVEMIVGTRTPFEQAEVLTDEMMEDSQLYLLSVGERKPLRLFPLVKVMPSPKTAANACYFYNRMEGTKGLRFVSYHFEQDADITDGFPDTADALRQLMADD